MINLLNYPPTNEQLELLMGVGLNNMWGLIVMRWITLVITFVVLWQWQKLISNNFSKVLGIVSTILLVISPTLWIIVLSYPMLVLKLGLVVLLFRLLRHKWAVLILIVMLIVFNLRILSQKPAMLSKLSFKDAAAEVTARFNGEDSLRIKMELPLAWRRLSYNKYFVVYRQALGEVLPFFDLESLFFQEVHPMEQKSVVMFYWPEIFLLMLGIFYWKDVKNSGPNRLIVYLLLLGLVNFVFSDATSYQRLYLVMLPLSAVLAVGIVGLANNSKLALGVAFFLVAYGTWANIYDLNNRPDFWLDNRPLVYQYWFSNLKNVDRSQYSHIQISTIVGGSEQYCEFYLGQECRDSKYVFSSFDLTKPESTKGLYLGFTGEFIGSKFKNDFDNNWESNLSGYGLALVSKQKIRDTVAYRYGNDIGLVIKQ